MKTLIIGNGARESALAYRMSQDSTLYAVMNHKNPTIVGLCEKTGGSYLIADVTDADKSVSFAKDQGVDMVMLSADDPLSKGVVDAFIEAGIRIVGPTKSGAEIEWNKEYSRAVLEKINPSVNPVFSVLRTTEDLKKYIDSFNGEPVVIKPLGLTGGKGVKVVGPHLKDNEEAYVYACSLLELDGSVIVEEKIIGVEFTIQAITDGEATIFPPATFDYPYRYEDDKGPGTGGMGVYSVNQNPLPFMSLKQYEDACDIIRKILVTLKSEGRHYTGVMYGGFFATNKGELKVIEINARFGDPEGINVLSLFEGNWCDVMQAISEKQLTTDLVSFKKHVSQSLYLVSPNYAVRKQTEAILFDIDVAAIEALGCNVFFSSSEHVSGTTYKTVGNSRCVSISCTAETLVETRARIEKALAFVKGDLEWRTDIASDKNIIDMCQITGVTSF